MTKEAIREHQMARTGGAQTDLFTCGKCRKKSCTYTQVRCCRSRGPVAADPGLRVGSVHRGPSLGAAVAFESRPCPGPPAPSKQHPRGEACVLWTLVGGPGRRPGGCEGCCCCSREGVPRLATGCTAVTHRGRCCCGPQDPGERGAVRATRREGPPQGPGAATWAGVTPIVTLGKTCCPQPAALTDRSRPCAPSRPQVQTRSSDEPMTTFVVCNECGNRWKVGG